MNHRKFLFYLLVIVMISSCGGSSDSSIADESAAAVNIVNISPSAASELINSSEDLLILDVRTSEEFSGGHIPNAVNIDFYASNFKELIAELDKEKKVLLHCKSGGRSGKTLKILAELGFDEVAHLDSGIVGWRGAGLPEIKP